MRTTIVILPVKIRIKHKTVKGKDGALGAIKDALRGVAVIGGMEDATHFDVSVAGFKRIPNATPSR